MVPARIAPCGEHYAPRRCNADRRRTAHDEVANRLRDLFGRAAVDECFLAWQQALIEQAQAIALPEHGADRIMGMHGSGHRRHVRRIAQRSSATFRAPLPDPRADILRQHSVLRRRPMLSWTWRKP